MNHNLDKKVLTINWLAKIHLRLRTIFFCVWIGDRTLSFYPSFTFGFQFFSKFCHNYSQKLHHILVFNFEYETRKKLQK